MLQVGRSPWTYFCGVGMLCACVCVRVLILWCIQSGYFRGVIWPLGATGVLEQNRVGKRMLRAVPGEGRALGFMLSRRTEEGRGSHILSACGFWLDC